MTGYGDVRHHKTLWSEQTSVVHQYRIMFLMAERIFLLHLGRTTSVRMGIFKNTEREMCLVFLKMTKIERAGKCFISNKRKRGRVEVGEEKRKEDSGHNYM